MRICLYTDSAGPATGEREAAVDALARRFRRFGHQPVVLAPRRGDACAAFDRTLPYPVFRHPRFYSTWRLIGWYGRWLKQLHSRYRFDVIHCHGVHPTAYVAANCRTLNSLPLVITTHAGDLRPECRHFANPVAQTRLRATLQRAGAVIAIGAAAEANLRRLDPGLSRLERMPDGVDVEQYQSPVLRPGNLDESIGRHPYFLCLGPPHCDQDADVLLNAFARVARNRKAQLVVAGSDSERTSLESRAAHLNLGQAVRFVGAVRGSTKVYLLQHALCTVIPSHNPGSHSAALLESYAAGRPVVASSAAGLAELAFPNRTGLLVEPESSDSLAAALEMMAGKPKLVRRMGREARRIAHGHDWSAIGQRYLACFDDLLAGQAAAPLRKAA